jgi:hypothetical protein
VKLIAHYANRLPLLPFADCTSLQLRNKPAKACVHVAFAQVADEGCQCRDELGACQWLLKVCTPEQFGPSANYGAGIAAITGAEAALSSPLVFTAVVS